MDKNLTKAQTLVEIEKRLVKAKIAKSYVFTVNDWKQSKTNVIEKIQKIFNNNLIIIRSSALREDGKYSSMAGAFESVKNVNSSDFKSIKLGVSKVVSSYGKRVDNRDEILIQKMIDDVSMSGVVFTHELNHGSPYYVINYDDVSGLTDTVTSGDGEYSNRTIYIYRNALNKIKSERFKLLIESIIEVEKVMNSNFLDIEFALTKNLNIFILQVRSISTQSNWNRSVVNKINSEINGISNILHKKFKKLHNIYGKTTIYGQMPDWNPAEMIGRAPEALSFSLYEKLITENAWRNARYEMGYNVPVGQPLMISLAGQPFIDTRLSFNSFLPKELPKKISEKLVNCWLEKLKANPELHDKIEFDIAITNYSFDIDKKLNNLNLAISNRDKDVIKNTYRNHLINLFKRDSNGSIKSALDRIKTLEKNQNNFSNLNNLEDLFKIVDDCINFGTIPFSILARHGFIAKTLINSLIDLQIIKKEEANEFLNSISTIASELVLDVANLKNKKLDKNFFLKKYGHLRPGTYDIMSKCYNQMDNFWDNENNFLQNLKNEKFSFSRNQKLKIDNLLANHGFEGFDSNFIIRYIEKAVAGREYGKFVFTRSVSKIIEVIAGFGVSNFLSREELSHIPINDLMSITKKSINMNFEKYLRNISEINKEKNLISKSIRLPQVLHDINGIFVVPFQVCQPNFIGEKKIVKKSIFLTDNNYVDLSNKIVLIENADPGYDWIFSMNIAGLVTKYGGANSHMAIRCAEFQIPAAIGCGEQRFEVLKKSNKIMLDCSSSLIVKAD